MEHGKLPPSVGKNNRKGHKTITWFMWVPRQKMIWHFQYQNKTNFIVSQFTEQFLRVYQQESKEIWLHSRPVYWPHTEQCKTVPEMPWMRWYTISHDFLLVLFLHFTPQKINIPVSPIHETISSHIVNDWKGVGDHMKAVCLNEVSLCNCSMRLNSNKASGAVLRSCILWYDKWRCTEEKSNAANLSKTLSDKETNLF